MRSLLVALLLLSAQRSSAFSTLSTVPTMAVNMEPKVVICGAGVIGANIAYQLSLRGVAQSVTVVDRVGVAPAASGKAGGFLALDWNDGAAVGPLSRKSFEMHAQLAKDLELDSYRRLTCSAVAVDGGGKPLPKKLANVEWVDLGAQGTKEMGDESTIAQVHPKQLTTALMDAAQKKGCTLKIGRVDGVRVEGEGADQKATGVSVDGEMIDADAVVIAMGPWTYEAMQWLPLPPMYGQKYHSLLYNNARTLTQAVFFQGLGDPEVYPRPDNEVYVTGYPDSPITVKETPGEEEVREEVCERLMKAMKMVSSELGDATVKTRQSCHLPVTPDGVPIIGKVPGVAGAYVASGHSCWGILNSPATGLAMAELILDGEAKCVDLGVFDPARFGLRAR
mmetsp:Transcript_28655/g.70940  ORF Transcript_28655/g.70940 Transcript_28655/m.70940 type:complete len:393 (-) Transcript_28655:2377-3555(-)